MEVRRGILGGVAERVLSVAALVLLAAVGWSIYQMPSETKQAILSGIWYTLVWVVVAAALPWSGKLYMRRVLDAGSNWAGLALIAALTALDAVIGLIFMGGLPDSGWTWLAALGALAVAATYNYLVSEYLAEMAGG